MNARMSSLSLSWREASSRFVSRILNGVLRRFGWWTHGSPDSHRRWFHRESDVRIKNRLQTIAFESAWFRTNFGWAMEFRLRHDSEGTMQLYFSIPFILAHWITLDIGYLDWVERITGQYGARMWGWNINSSAIQFKWGKLDDRWGTKVKDGYEFYWSWTNLRGKVTYTKVELEKHVLTFEQPAYKNRPASTHEITLTLEDCTWKFANILVPTRRKRYWNISLDNPPKFSGKGENAHDCGDDGIYGCACDGNLSIAEAIAHYIKLVERNRQRYG